MIDCAIYQACLPGKSDKRNIYPPSFSSKPPVMDEHRAECKINLPNTTISGLESWMKSSFQLISCVILTTADYKLLYYRFVETTHPGRESEKQRSTKTPPMCVGTFDALSKESCKKLILNAAEVPRFEVSAVSRLRVRQVRCISGLKFQDEIWMRAR